MYPCHFKGTQRGEWDSDDNIKKKHTVYSKHTRQYGDVMSEVSTKDKNDLILYMNIFIFRWIAHIAR